MYFITHDREFVVKEVIEARKAAANTSDCG